MTISLALMNFGITPSRLPGNKCRCKRCKQIMMRFHKIGRRPAFCPDCVEKRKHLARRIKTATEKLAALRAQMDTT